MNKYQNIVELIEKNNLEIHSNKTKDSASGWSGENLWIIDPENNKKIYDLSGNGYCFKDDSVDRAIESIKKYLLLRDMDSFDSFKEYVDIHKKGGD